MASQNRERKAIVSVPCPKCGARRGELCKIRPVPGRLVIHGERRSAWQEWKRKTGQKVGGP